VAYFDQLHNVLDESVSAADNVNGGRPTVEVNGKTRQVVSYLRDFLFTADQARGSIEVFSGGERARLALARLFARPSNVLVLDEPTNDLDLPSLRMLEEALADFDGSVICVSHDRYFLDRICDQIIAFEEDGVFVQPGNYSYYLEKRQAREAAQRIQAQAAAKDAAARRKAAERPARPRKLTFKEKAELEGIESAILAAEQAVEAIEIQLHDPEFQATRFAEIPALVEKLDTAKAEVARHYSRWEELEAIRAASPSA